MKNEKKQSVTATFNTKDQLDSIGIIDIAYKKTGSADIDDRPVISNSSDTYQLCLHYWDLDKINIVMESKILFLNQGSKVLELYPLSQGGITSATFDIRLIMRAALRLGAVSMILVYNHPSGTLTPSPEVKELVERLKKAAQFFDINLFDCLIITSKNYFSFLDTGHLQNDSTSFRPGSPE